MKFDSKQSLNDYEDGEEEQESFVGSFTEEEEEEEGCSSDEANIEDDCGL